MARVLGRVRLSVEKEESTSPEKQVQFIETWARDRDHTVIGWAVDLGLSGKVSPFDAPEFGPWLRPDKLDQWDIVCGWKLSRFARRATLLGNLFGFMTDSNKILACTHDPVDLSTPIGRLIADVIKHVADWELEEISDRVAGTQAYLRQLGRYKGGRPPYGYRKVRMEVGYTLELDPETAPIAKDMIASTIAGELPSEIADRFNAAGIPSPAGKKWWDERIRDMIRSPQMVGRGTHKGELVVDGDGVPVQFGPPLVSLSDHADAITALAGRGRVKRRKNGASSLLDVAFCDECGAKLYRTKFVSHGKDASYWRCGGRTNLRNGCSQRGVQADYIESYVDKLIGVAGANVYRTETIHIPADDRGAEITELESRIRKMALVSDLSDDEFMTKLTAYRARLDVLRANPYTPARTELRPIEPRETYADAWGRMTATERRDLLLEAGIRVYVRDKRVVRDVTPGTWLRDVQAWST